MRSLLFIFSLTLPFEIFSQEEARKTHVFVPVQFAGSIGLASAGAGLQSRNRKLEGSVIYGFLPERLGGPVHTATIKLGYEPFRIRVNDQFTWHAFQTGLFFAQHFGYQLQTFWDSRYPKGYYWWPRNTRQHLYLATGISYKHVACFIRSTTIYLEANTNDLYLYSYIPNTRSVSPFNIVFLGAGVKVFLN